MGLSEKVAVAEQLAKQVQETFDSLHKDLRTVEDQIHGAFKQILEQSKVESQFKTEELESFIKLFLKRPYGVVPKKEGEWYLWVPKIFPLNVGWFDREEGAYNVYVVNRYVDLVQPIPEELKRELDLHRPFDGIVVRGDQLLIEKPDQDSVKKVFNRYKDSLLRIEDQATIRIKPGKSFPLIATLIRDGILPFLPQPVDPTDRLERHVNIKLREYQEEDVKKFFIYGHVGIFYPMGQGKTMVALEAMSQLKGRKLVLVPTITLQEKWQEDIQKFTQLTQDEYEIVVYHASHIPRLMKEQWTIVVYDEMDRLGAETYLQFAALKAKYRIFETATPFREDGRIDLIWAISGMPLHVNWEYFISRGLIKKPNIEVRIVKDMNAKFEELNDYIARTGKTIIFSDSLEYGKDIASQYSIPFIFGETKHRLDAIRSADKLVMSRVGDLGISVAKLQRVIEFDFLFGSRRQELQRLGRLFHSEYRGEHVILMTAEEYSRYRKRLYGIYEKGFDIKITRGEGVPDDVTLSTHMPSREKAPKFLPKLATPKPIAPTTTVPMPFIKWEGKTLPEVILELCSSSYSESLHGLTPKDIHEVLTSHNGMTVSMSNITSALTKMRQAQRIRYRAEDSRYWVAK